MAIESGVDLTPLLGSLLELTAAAVTGVVGWALRRYLGIRADNEVRGYLETALNRAAAYGLSRARAEYGHLDSVSIKNAALEAGVRYVVEAVPDALKRFQVTPERVRDLVEARMP